MTKFRLYMDIDAETDWLNRLAERGYALKKYFLGFYTFEKTEPGEYIYQIDLLESVMGDRRDFEEFMEETGVEVVAQWYRWVYLRKEAAEGPFEMYTDNESKIENYRRIRNFFRIGLIVESICLVMELVSAVATGETALWFCVALLVSFVLAFLRTYWRLGWKVEQLEKAK